MQGRIMAEKTLAVSARDRMLQGRKIQIGLRRVLDKCCNGTENFQIIGIVDRLL